MSGASARCSCLAALPRLTSTAVRAAAYTTRRPTMPAAPRTTASQVLYNVVGMMRGKPGSDSLRAADSVQGQQLTMARIDRLLQGCGNAQLSEAHSGLHAYFDAMLLLLRGYSEQAETAKGAAEGAEEKQAVAEEKATTKPAFGSSTALRLLAMDALGVHFPVGDLARVEQSGLLGVLEGLLALGNDVDVVDTSVDDTEEGGRWAGLTHMADRAKSAKGQKKGLSNYFEELAGSHTALTRQSLTKVVEHYDVDKDGVLSVIEMRLVLEHFIGAIATAGEQEFERMPPAVREKVEWQIGLLKRANLGLCPLAPAAAHTALRCLSVASNMYSVRPRACRTCDEACVREYGQEWGRHSRHGRVCVELRFRH